LLAEKLLEASQAEPKRLSRWLPASVFAQLVSAATILLTADETLVEVKPPADARVVVVGDTHGQLHDVLHMLQLTGGPGLKQWYVFNGDFVDRGAWGVETLALLLAWKLACPAAVTLLRGNHESEFCVSCYGFLNEMKAKYTVSTVAELFPKTLRLFAVLPLAALVGKTLVLHGGLFRKEPPRAAGAKRKRGGADIVESSNTTATGTAPEEASSAPLPLECLGSLDTLRHAFRGGLDPDGVGRTQVACDVMWSDPGPAGAPSMVFNDARGVGMIFGPSATEAFCDANDVRLVIRSHEGPDARDKREGMQDMLSGWSVDHVCPSGARLATLFSAPDYPQFYAPGTERLNNKAAVAVLTGAPDWCNEVNLITYEAAPRPPAQPFYDLDEPGSDEEGPAPGTTATEEPQATPEVVAPVPPRSPAEEPLEPVDEPAASPAVIEPSQPVDEPAPSLVEEPLAVDVVAEDVFLSAEFE